RRRRGRKGSLQRKSHEETRSGCPRAGEGNDFLPLEGKEQRIREKQPEEPENTATILYIGHIPHGFYEDHFARFVSVSRA
uniref:Uncharacterized protein n=1 Tax=Aegilops tauschii subsp. strangulata TaxID=200361 RepID=A0A453RVP3_AEGTS